MPTTTKRRRFAEAVETDNLGVGDAAEPCPACDGEGDSEECPECLGRKRLGRHPCGTCEGKGFISLSCAECGVGGDF